MHSKNNSRKPKRFVVALAFLRVVFLGFFFAFAKR